MTWITLIDKNGCCELPPGIGLEYEYSFAGMDIHGPDHLPAGATRLRFTNHDEEMRLMLICRLADGESIENVIAWLKSAQAGRPMFGRTVAGVTNLLAGGSLHLNLALDSGRYVFICLIQLPRIVIANQVMGVIKEITVERVQTGRRSLTEEADPYSEQC